MIRARLQPGIVLLFVATLAISTSAHAARKPKFRVETLAEPCAEEAAAESIRTLLSEAGFRILDRKGKPYIDVWLTRCAATISAKKKQGINYPQFAEGTLLGLVRYHRKVEDFRGQGCKPGYYTLRYVVQPEDGDHQGVSPSRDFLALVRAEADTTPEPKSAKELVKLSKKVVRSGHPAILYLTEHYEKGEELPRLVENEDEEHWILECVVPLCPDSEGKKQEPLRLWIVIDGIAPE